MKLFGVVFLLFSLNGFANCVFHTENQELLPMSVEALEYKGYKLGTHSNANFSLVHSLEIISYDQEEGKKFASFDVVGQAGFLPINGTLTLELGTKRESVVANYYHVKVTKISKLDKAVDQAKLKAYLKLDEKLSFKIEEYLKPCK